MAKFVSDLILALLLISLSEWRLSPGAEASAVAACGYISNDTVLLLSCTPHPGDLPIKVVTERGLTVSLLDTSVTLNNATQLTLEPPQQFHMMKLDVEIKNCGLSGLLLLPEVAESPHLLLNLSGLNLRLGDQDQFANCGQVAALNLSRNRIHVVPTNAFNGLSSLVALDLSQNLIEHLDNNTFCELTSLRWLDIRDNPMMMTFALTKLPALESLDASMSVLEVGVFCRMSSLRRLALHQTVDQLQCFVFDNLPNLRNLSFSYFAGSSSICFTMMCDPHPVLGGRVPFNFRITQVNRNRTIVKISDNNFITKLKLFSRSMYVKVCKTNYDNYLVHHNNNEPLTTGCLKHENDSSVCPSPASQHACPLPTSPMLAIPTVEPEISTNSILTDQPTKAVVTTTAFKTETEASEVFGTALGDSTTIPVTNSNTSSPYWNATAEVTGAAVSNPPGGGRSPPRHLAELEAEIVHLERVIVVVYSINGVLLLGMLALLGCCLRARYLHWRDRRRRGRWPETDEGWLRQQRQQTQLLHDRLATNGVAARQVPQQESYGYLPTHDPVGGPKLTEAIANPNYGQADDKP